MTLADPVVQSVIVPAIAALVMAGVLRVALGSARGERLAAASIGMAVVVALLLIPGDPVWPPRSATQKLLPVFTALALAGLALDLVNANRRTTLATMAVAIITLSMWLGWPRIASADLHGVALVVTAAVLGWVSLLGLQLADETGATRPAATLVACLGLAGASLAAGSLVLCQLALAVAAATGGFAAWSWPVARLPFRASGLMAAGVGFYALGLVTLLLTGIRPIALMVLLMVFTCPAIARRLPVPRRWQRHTLEPLYVVAMALLPVLLAVAISSPAASDDDVY